MRAKKHKHSKGLIEDNLFYNKDFLKFPIQHTIRKVVSHGMR